MENVKTRRSEQMTKEEVRNLAKYVSTFPTKEEAAEAIGVSRQALHRVMSLGSGRTTTLMAIRERLSA
jgi:predicted DNA-binding protein (UPF0251 family)